MCCYLILLLIIVVVLMILIAPQLTGALCAFLGSLGSPQIFILFFRFW